MASSMSMDIPVQNLFFQAVALAFKNWTGFQLAVEHGFGGKDTKEKAEWFLNATYEWIVENENLDEYELQDFFEDTMDQEFNTQLEDSSAIIISRLILGFYKMYKNGHLNELSADLAQRYPKKASNVENSKRQQGENPLADEDTSSSGSDSSDDENNNEDNCEDMNYEESNTQKVNKLDAIRESEDFQMVDDGWTFVAKAGKKLTK